MILFEVSLIVGALLMAPALIMIVLGLCAFACDFWRKHTWEEIVMVLFYTGIAVIILGTMLAACDEKMKEHLTADASTDTQQEIPPQVENLNQEELPK